MACGARARRRTAIATAVALATLLGVDAVGSTEPEVAVVIVNPARAQGALDQRMLYAIFTGAIRSWPDGTPIVPFNLPPESRTRIAFEAAVLKMTPEQVARFWVDQRVRANGRPPRQVPDGGVAARLVAKMPEAISYVAPSEVAGAVHVVARIREGKVIAP